MRCFYEKGNKAKAVFGSNHGSTSLGLWKCWERNQKQEQQVLRVGIDSELSTADVSLAMDNTAVDVMSQVGEGLFSFDEKGEAKPALATEKYSPPMMV